MAKKHGHHGGAWKVAYADFVTAMMALFLVLWLTAQDEKIKEAIERSFKNPFASIIEGSASPIVSKDPPKVPSAKGHEEPVGKIELTFLRALSKELQMEMNDTDNKDTTKLELLSDGLRISVFDKSQKPIFRKDSEDLTDYGEWVLSTVAWQVARYTNFVVELEGHTEARDPVKLGDLDQWELSSKRANISRKILLKHGVRDHQVRKVVGYADKRPMPGTAPNDEANRRVTVMLRIRPED